jgi:hypothetical protein
MMYLELDRPEEAVPMFEAAARYDPMNLSALMGLSLAYRSQDQLSLSQAATSVQNGQYGWSDLMAYLRHR